MSNVKAKMSNQFQSSNIKFDIGILALIWNLSRTRLRVRDARFPWLMVLDKRQNLDFGIYVRRSIWLTRSCWRD